MKVSDLFQTADVSRRWAGVAMAVPVAPGRGLIPACVFALALIALPPLTSWTVAQSAARLTDVIRAGDATRAMEMLKHGASAQAAQVPRGVPIRSSFHSLGC